MTVTARKRDVATSRSGGEVRAEPSPFTMLVERSAEASPDALGIELAPARNLIRVKPRGELDLATCQQLNEQIAELLAAGFVHLAIDLRGLSFIDASGVRLLLGLAAAARSDGWRLSLIRCSRLHRIFILTATEDRLPFCAVDVSVTGSVGGPTGSD
jgi:anti-sigma B factor antagonist